MPAEGLCVVFILRYLCRELLYIVQYINLYPLYHVDEIYR